jgi:hypothetical protein
VTSLKIIIALAAALPVMAAAPERCPWLNAATAGGILGGPVRVEITPASCEFTRESGSREMVLRIEVAPTSAPHATCGAGAESLKAIGNEAHACAFSAKPGWLAEQVTGRVRDQAFLVRLSTNDASTAPKTLREKACNIAEQVAGILF